MKLIELNENYMDQSIVKGLVNDIRQNGFDFNKFTDLMFDLLSTTETLEGIADLLTPMFLAINVQQRQQIWKFYQREYKEHIEDYGEEEALVTPGEYELIKQLCSNPNSVAIQYGIDDQEDLNIPSKPKRTLH